MKATIKKYPNGTEYQCLSVCGDVIGIADIVPGGFLVTGRRKPVATLKEAAKQLISSKINKCEKELYKLKMLEKAISE